MLHPIALTLLAVAAAAQSIPDARNQDDLARAAKNPYDFARFIDSHNGFDWNVMWSALGAEPSDLLNNRMQYSTELITILEPDQIIVLVQGESTPFDVYLRFMQEKAGAWRFSGVYGAIIHNHPRRHEVDRSSGKPFLRVSSQGVRGSDVDCEMEDWFDLTQPGFEPVFAFPVQGHQGRIGGIGRDITATLIAQADTIHAVLAVQFSGGGHGLGYCQYTAVYARSKGAKTFAFQNAGAGQSGISRAAFDLDEGPSDEDLIRYAFPGLKELATGNDSEAKGWLKQLLAMADNTPEVRELKALLK